MTMLSGYLFVFLCIAADVCAKPAWPGSCKSTETADEKLTGIDLNGKIFVTTGADGNIATQVNLALAKRGATLILACRSQAKCEAVRKSVEQATGEHGKVFLEELDLSSIKNVQDFASRIIARHPKGIHALINSAGTYGTFETKDGFVAGMQINLLAPALLTNLLLPVLRGGRVVNVAAATYGVSFGANVTVSQIASWCRKLDPALNATGNYFPMSKFLMTHHAIELARREPNVTAFAVNPGVALMSNAIPSWLVRFPYPEWFLNRLPPIMKRIHEACTTNLAGFERCPETFDNAAAVVAVAAAWPNIEHYSGSYLDFDTSPLPPDAPQVYGPFVQKDPTCQPRQPPPMDAKLRSAWYDEMLRLMSSPAAEAHRWIPEMPQFAV
mmetsp:Transcript_64099/g.111776  ORF Transcript_64099/g.111776 Transcript_64099/m.111776 type:complete len:384 (-) Transcript_64099:6-1157(-)